MSVRPIGVRGRGLLAAVLVALVATAGCGDEDAGDAGEAGEVGSAPVSTATGDPAAAPSPPPSPPSSAPTSPPPAGLSGTLVVTRQRDLIDRGLINVLTRNDSGDDILITSRQLVLAGMATEPATPRTIKVGDGRQVAIQVPYGTATGCDDTAPAPAVLRITYAVGSTAASPDSEPQVADVALDGTEILDAIRAEQCTAQLLDEATDISVGDVDVDGETVRATIVVELVDPSVALTLGDASGTILVAARRTAEGPVVVDASSPTAEVGVEFSVNRCDPHALAEVTKRYGIDLDVSVDGADPVAVGIDVTDLVDALEGAVEACRVRTGQ